MKAGWAVCRGAAAPFSPTFTPRGAGASATRRHHPKQNTNPPLLRGTGGDALGVWTPTQLSYGKTRGTDSLSPGLFFKINVTATPQYRVGAQ